MISRGLSELSFYEKMLQDRYIANLQVSVDVLPELDSLLVPDRERLSWFVKYPNVIFRFKTTTYNVHHFMRLQEELGIPRMRVMETPLRLPELSHIYGTRTYLEEAGWKTSTFGRCNTMCQNCHAENGVLLCAAKAPLLERLPFIERPPPPRYRSHQVRLPKGAVWKREAIACMTEHGGKCTVQEAYAWYLKKYPVLEFGKPNWTFKVRVALQRAGVSAGQSTWKLKPEYQNTILVVEPHSTSRGK